MTNKTGNKTLGITNNYLELITKFHPRKITSEDELDATQKIIDTLLDQGNLTIDERDYLHLLGLLVSEYEDVNYPIPDIYGVELLKVLIEEHNLTKQDLILLFESEENLREVLNKKQPLTFNQMEKLAHFFHVSPAVFFKEN